MSKRWRPQHLMLQEGKVNDALEVYSIWPLQIILGNKGEHSMEGRSGKRASGPCIRSRWPYLGVPRCDPNLVPVRVHLGLPWHFSHGTWGMRRSNVNLKPRSSVM